MASEFTLASPFLDYTMQGVPKHWKLIITAWMLFWFTVCIGLLYLYAVVLPGWIGFESTLLVGVALIVLGTSND